MLTELETKIIASIQDDIPVTERPYLEIAQKLEITEETLLATLKDLTAKGVIRRFGATIRHQKSGFASNAMVAWQVEESRIDEVGEKLATFREISHCYRRNPNKAWPYNLYTMVHAGDEASCLEIVGRLAAETSIDTYTVLFSRKELKKTSMQYISTDEDD
ncbi:MAG: Lrp/AsnC family transcriptional regulator [Pseudomonadota bacterium]|uniref:siroheme decarboxylase n=1 Tax=Candidatus Desulfatibia profunda TaxID=2841695 RepID=A0A8J6NQI6_9BACT|nr:Lrp/AsnC family transcriptional regulator [Candidatus Desulfatibia profunda]MBL7179441.1 Lrp/AsnC family transcriptional regulator [Desulfobacterales bacterium]